MSMVNAQQHIIRYAFSTLLIRTIPFLRHRKEAEMLAERVQEIKASLESERNEREALVARSKELEETYSSERQSLQVRVDELEAFQAHVLAERQIERFAVRQDDKLFQVHSHACPQCHKHYGGFTSKEFEEARRNAEYLNGVAHCGVQSVLCESCSSYFETGAQA
ncbi:MAG: hypothetical protein ACYCYO_01490 [Bacilli bacterium]